MKSPEDNPLLKAGLRHELTPHEQAEVLAYVGAHPEACPDWEQDLCLNEMLRQLPDQAVSTNFTARVVQAVGLAVEPKTVPVSWWHRWGIGRWVPKAALAIVVLAAGLLSYREYQTHERLQMAERMASFCRVSSLVSVDALRDFDAINRLGQAPVKVDEELLAALK